MNKRKIVIILIVVFTLLILITSVFIFLKIKEQNGIKVSINVAPIDSNIIIDDKKNGINGINYLSAGKHKVIFKRSGFSNQEQNITVGANNNKTILMTLVPNNSEGTNYYNSHKDDFMEIESLGSQQFLETGKIISQNYPLVNELPIDANIFRIDYGASKKYPNEPTKTAIYISSSNPTDKFAAIKNIYEMGYDPSDYEIIFKDIK